MAESTQYRSYDDPDIEAYDDETEHYPVGSYKFGRSAQDNSVPLFLSDPDGEPYPEEFENPGECSGSGSGGDTGGAVLFG